SKAAVLELADDLTGQVENSVIEKVSAYMKPAGQMSIYIADLIERGQLSLTDTNALDAQAVQTLLSFPQLAMVNIGDVDGNFLMAKRMPDGTIHSKIVRQKEKETIWIRRDHELKVLKTEKEAVVDYDPRVRPWYKNAIAKDGLIWTDVYLFFTDKKLGITASYPIRDKDGAVIGVIGNDIMLKQLSEFMKEVKVGKSGKALIYNDNDTIVAYPDPQQTTRQIDGEWRTVKLNELDDSAAKKGCEELKTNNRVFFEDGGEDYIATLSKFPGSFGRQWNIALIVPEKDFTGPVRSANRRSMLIGFGILIVSIFLVSILAKKIARPIIQLTEETDKIKDFDLSGTLEINSPVYEIQRMAASVNSMKNGLRAFEKYVPAELVRELIATGNEARIGGERKNISILFADIEGFTSISEKMDPEELLPLISNYLDVIATSVKDHQGTVDKFIGDAVMAFWGAPRDLENHAQKACEAALRSFEAVEALNTNSNTSLSIRVGIHSGDCVVGNVGSKDRMNYTAVGDTVNLASRLESINKFYQLNCIVSEETKNACDTSMHFRLIDHITVKGRKTGCNIYQLTAFEADINDTQRELTISYEKAFAAYRDKDWDTAQEILNSLKDQADKFPPITILQSRISELKENPPENWTGVFIHTSKG
ncbi:MAG: adenylate/guanylate cyclase domain-containing protein, partial [Lentisphaeria bacterium]|nr:Cache 3/Cache 2 fusion domain-containing protein [Lentisphaeria bacterium]NQZ68740.1 adenylate/guanylate cyclase domain-containing protein [Lentisphaeria bacterium]